MTLRVLVIYKKSAYQVYVRERKNPRIRALLRSGDPTVSRLIRADLHHRETLERARVALKRLGVHAVFRYRSSPGIAQGFDLVVTLGGDGTLLWASHLVGSQTPVVSVNTAPKDSVGYLAAGVKDDVEDVLASAVLWQLPEVKLARMQVALDGRVISKRILNDALFCHESPAATTRAVMRFGARSEEQKSSGVWVGPAAGSTAALRSAGGKVMPVRSRSLQFVVREPYHPLGKPYRLASGIVRPGGELVVHSQVRSAGVYLDGPHWFEPVLVGSDLAFRVSDEPLTLLGFARR